MVADPPPRPTLESPNGSNDTPCGRERPPELRRYRRGEPMLIEQTLDKLNARSPARWPTSVTTRSRPTRQPLSFQETLRPPRRRRVNCPRAAGSNRQQVPDAGRPRRIAKRHTRPADPPNRHRQRASSRARSSNGGCRGGITPRYVRTPRLLHNSPSAAAVGPISPWQNSAARRNWPALARKRLGSARFR